MAECIVYAGGGGGAYSDDLTATAAYVYPGKVYVGNDTGDEAGTGTMATVNTSAVFAASTAVTAVAGGRYCLNDITIAALSHSNLVAENIRSGVTITVNNGSTNVYSVTGTFTSGATATEGYIYPGKTAGVDGSIKTGTMATKAEATMYATASTQQIAASGRVATGAHKIAAMSASNYSAANIRNGVTISVSNGSTNIYSVAGTFTSDATVVASQVYTGKTIGGKGSIITGTMASKAAATFYATTATQLIASSGRCCAAQSIAAMKQTNLAAGNIRNGVTISVSNGSSNIWSVAGTFGSDATATAAYIYPGKTAGVGGSIVTGTMATKAAATYTPTTANQTISSGRYLTGAQTIAGASTLVASNIRTGKVIAGVTGNVVDFSSSQATWVNP